jgi:HSP20 family protein
MTTESSASAAPAEGDKAPSSADPPVAGSERPPLAMLRQEMDRLFDDFFSTSPFAMLRRRHLDADPWRRLQSVFDATAPVVDVAEREKEYRITAELPGMTEADIDIAVANGMLTIKGNKKQETTEEKQDRVVSERRYGAFQRSFAVPEDADPEGIAANMKDGLLTIVLPKRADAAGRRRKIDVKSG